MAEEDETLGLVRKALDEFDDVSLETSSRRAYRIARQRGDAHIGHRLELELRPIGGPVEDRWRTARDIHGDLSDEEIRAASKAALEEFLKARKPARHSDAGGDEPVVRADSIGDIEKLARELHTDALEAVRDPTVDHDTLSHIQLIDRDTSEILERTRQWVFSYLVAAEAQLNASDDIHRTLLENRARVDALIDQHAPEIRDQLGGALRAARHEADSIEARSQVMTSCRRLLESAADLICPPGTPIVSDAGDPVDSSRDARVNRLVEGLKDVPGGEALGASAAYLYERLIRLDTLTSKGTHSAVSQSEMRFALSQTYLVVGEAIEVYEHRTD